MIQLKSKPDLTLPLPRLFITCGDPHGVGPEVTLKALSLLPKKIRSSVLLAAPYQALTELNRLLGEPLALTKVESLQESFPPDKIPVLELAGAKPCRPSYGRVMAEAGLIAGRGVSWGTSACLQGHASALVTAPLSKEALQLAGYDYPGQTEMISARCGVTRSIMILCSGQLRVGLATTHVAIRDVSRLLTQEVILDKVTALNAALQTWFNCPEPRLAVAALNPHASDGGLFGPEEKEIIAPALAKAQQRGLNVVGPFPADTLFPRWKLYDGILALYHDQGMIPIKMAAFGKAVNLTSGLPFPRTSPDHGTAFDIAGQLKADPKSMLNAIQLAYQLALHRKLSLPP